MEWRALRKEFGRHIQPGQVDELVGRLPAQFLGLGEKAGPGDGHFPGEEFHGEVRIGDILRNQAVQAQQEVFLQIRRFFFLFRPFPAGKGVTLLPQVRGDGPEHAVVLFDDGQVPLGIALRMLLEPFQLQADPGNG